MLSFRTSFPGSARSPGLAEYLPMEFQGEMQILVQIAPAVVAGPQDELMREILGRKNLIQLVVPSVKTVAVLVATVKVEL
jgi:hypothetical protein